MPLPASSRILQCLALLEALTCHIYENWQLFWEVGDKSTGYLLKLQALRCEYKNNVRLGCLWQHCLQVSRFINCRKKKNVFQATLTNKLASSLILVASSIFQIPMLALFILVENVTAKSIPYHNVSCFLTIVKPLIVVTVPWFHFISRNIGLNIHWDSLNCRIIVGPPNENNKKEID